MVKPKSKPAMKEVANPADMNPADGRRDEQGNAGLPTTEQLAMIAASLARNTDLIRFGPAVLTKQALELWLWAQEQIHHAENDDLAGSEEKKRREATDDLNLYFKRSDKYPVTRKEFFKKLLPQVQGRLKKIAEIGKAYTTDKLVAENLRNNIFQKPTQDEIDLAFENLGPFQNHEAAGSEAWHFKNWHDRYLGNQRFVNSKRAAARMKRQNKNRSKKEDSDAAAISEKYI